MAERQLPAVSMGHVVIHTDDVSTSAAFYEALGLRGTASTRVPPEQLMLMEMRGGTDLVIMHREAGLISEFPQSNVSYSDHVAPIDIMIPEHGRDDLERYRGGLVDAGIEPGEIADEEKYGHWYFRLTDPDGYKITVLTSHSNFE